MARSLHLPGVVENPTLDTDLVREDTLWDLPIEADGEDEFSSGRGDGAVTMRRTVHGASYEEYLKVLADTRDMGVAYLRASCAAGTIWATGNKRSGPYIVTTSTVYDQEDNVIQLMMDPRLDEPEVDENVEPEQLATDLMDIDDECPPELVDAIGTE